MSAPGPQPMKPPTRQVPPTLPAMLRFVLGEDALGGQVLDLDFNTGLLLPAAMEGVTGRHPAFAPPALYLRALVANWRNLIAEPAPDTDVAKVARGTLASVADQLERTLDLMGVAAAGPDDPVATWHWPQHAVAHGAAGAWCHRCGNPLELVDGPGSAWVTEEGLAVCYGR